MMKPSLNKLNTQHVSIDHTHLRSPRLNKLLGMLNYPPFNFRTKYSILFQNPD